jgi:hypothetical protein
LCAKYCHRQFSLETSLATLAHSLENQRCQMKALDPKHRELSAGFLGKLAGKIRLDSF